MRGLCAPLSSAPVHPLPVRPCPSLPCVFLPHPSLSVAVRRCACAPLSTPVHHCAPLYAPLPACLFAPLSAGVHPWHCLSLPFPGDPSAYLSLCALSIFLRPCPSLLIKVALLATTIFLFKILPAFQLVVRVHPTLFSGRSVASGGREEGFLFVAASWPGISPSPPSPGFDPTPSMGW